MPKENEQYICAEFKAGKTMIAIAKELGVTYQAIHRILGKHGLSRKDGGKSAQVVAREADTTIDKVLSMCDKYGCTREQWDLLREFDPDYKKTPLAAFHTYKNNFNNLYPDIEFDLSLWDWWIIWSESLMWGKHKRNPDGMYVMAQKDKSLPLSKDNARIIPFGQLLKETRKTKTAAKNDEMVNAA